MKPLALAFSSTRYFTAAAMNISSIKWLRYICSKTTHIFEVMYIPEIDYCGKKKRRYAYSIHYRPNKELNYSTQIPGTVT